MSDIPEHGAHGQHAGAPHRVQPDSQRSEPPAEQDSGGITFGQLAGILRRQIVVVVVAALLGLLVGVDLLAITPKTYESTAVVDISSSLDATGTTSSTSTLNPITEAKIAVSTSVAAKAKDTLGFAGTPSDLTKNVTVTAPLDTEVLDVSYSADTAAGAANGANAFAEAYLSYRTATTQSDLDLRTAALKTRITALQKDLAADVAASVNSTQQGLLRDQIETLQNQLNTYQTSVVAPGQIAGVAPVPTSASSPNPTLYIGGGLLAGLLAGCVVALVRERRDDRVRTRLELAEVLSAPVLAQASVTALSASLDESSLATFVAGDGDEADAYRSVAATVTSGLAGRRVVVVCGAGTNGHSTVAAELAATFASQGLTTVLTGTREAISPATDSLGLEHEPELSDGPVPSSVRGLSVLSLGDELSLAVTLRSDGVSLDHLDRAELIVLDGINTDMSSSRLRLAQLADSAVVVAYQNRATREQLRELADQLRRAETTLVGSVLLDAHSSLISRIRRHSASAHSERGAVEPDAVDREAGLEPAHVD